MSVVCCTAWRDLFWSGYFTIGAPTLRIQPPTKPTITTHSNHSKIVVKPTLSGFGLVWPFWKCCGFWKFISQLVQNLSLLFDQLRNCKHLQIYWQICAKLLANWTQGHSIKHIKLDDLNVLCKKTVKSVGPIIYYC